MNVCMYIYIYIYIYTVICISYAQNGALISLALVPAMLTRTTTSGVRSSDVHLE